MEKNKVLFIAQEISPYVPDTHLSLLTRAVSQDLQSHKLEVRVFTPKYGCINERRNQLHEVIRLSGLNLPIDDNDHPLIIKVATLLPTRLQVYFIDNDDYFLTTSPGAILETALTPEVNDERMMFFALGVLETVKKLRWCPAVVHCSGWLAALVPLFLKDKYKDDPTFPASKIVLSLHSESFDNQLDIRLYDKMKMAGFAPRTLTPLRKKKADWLALNKMAIDHSDAFIIADANVPQELIDYALATKKPVLRAEEGEDISGHAVLDFYKTVIK